MATVSLVGASGYGGTELIRLLARHPFLDVAGIAAASTVGAPLQSVAPNFVASTGGSRVFESVDVEQLASADIVVLGTPDDVSLELAPLLLDAGARVVDLSGAFRLPAATYGTWYGREHTAPSLAADGQEAAVYGLTEHARQAVASARLVANPGCYPTATLLPLLPLAELLETDGIVVSAMSGTSGAGRTTKPHLQATEVHGDVSAYGAPTHRHTAEIEQHLTGTGTERPIVFTPHLVPMSRGIHATISAVLKANVRQQDLDDALRDAYDHEPFVHLLPPGTFPRTKAVFGSNSCQLSMHVDDRCGRVLLTSVIDNLVKGAAGQALQNMNVMLGFEETLGLDVIGMHP